MTEREFETIINKLDNLEKNVERDYQLLAEKLELYRQTSETKSNSIESQVNSVRAEVKAFQEANKQQLNVSLGVLVTAALPKALASRDRHFTQCRARNAIVSTDLVG